MPNWHGRLSPSPFVAALIASGVIQRRHVVVDLCCGAGIDSIATAIFSGATVLGIDRDEDAIDEARATAVRYPHARVRFQQGVIPKALECLPARSADVVIDILGTLNVDRRRSRIAPELWRILRPGGLWVSQQRAQLAMRDVLDTDLLSLLPRNSTDYFAFSTNHAFHGVDSAAASHRKLRAFVAVGTIGRRRARVVSNVSRIPVSKVLAER